MKLKYHINVWHAYKCNDFNSYLQMLWTAYRNQDDGKIWATQKPFLHPQVTPKKVEKSRWKQNWVNGCSNNKMCGTP